MTNTETILITGASGKLGRQMTRHFLACGNRVVVTSRNAETLADLASSMSGLPGIFEGVSVDLVQEGGRVLSERLLARGFLPNAVVNNAVDLSNQRLPDDGLPRREQWQTEFDLAVVAPFELVMALANLQGTPLSAVINISSMYGVVPRNPTLYDDPLHQSPIHYGVAKAAMIHLTKELAIRLAPRNIRVNAVSFGGVEGRVDATFRTRYASLCPTGRMLREDEIPASVAFLISDGASGITGHNLIVDGGWTVW